MRIRIVDSAKWPGNNTSSPLISCNKFEYRQIIMVGFISFVARSMGDLDSFAAEKNSPGYVMSHTEDMSRTKTANDAEGVSSAVCGLSGHVCQGVD